MPITQQNRTPSIGPKITATPNRVLDDIVCARGGGVIDGSLTRDPSNSTSPEYLLSGMPLGRVTASGKYAPAVIGLGEAYTSGQTEITTTLASAIELVRRIGSAGTFQYQGLVGGALVKTAVTYSAVDVGTGIITVTDLAATYAADAWIQPDDGSETLNTIYNGFNEGFPQRVTNEVTDSNVYLSFIPATAAWVLESGVTFWPVAGVFRNALRAELNVTGQFTFRESFVG